jgi:four helix bundle protein
MQDFKRLRVWHLANTLALKVIQALPIKMAREIPGLRNQAIRAATSVAANIAEGCARTTRVEFLHFLEIALGSLNELEGHLVLARDAGLVAVGLHSALQRDIDLVRRMLISLMRAIQLQIANDSSAPVPSRRTPR